MKNKFQPVKLILKNNKKYAWCSCGRTERLPFCDGTHKGSGYNPLIFKVEEDKEYYLCKCGNTKTAPFCDGTHKRFFHKQNNQ